MKNRKPYLKVVIPNNKYERIIVGVDLGITKHGLVATRNINGKIDVIGYGLFYSVKRPVSKLIGTIENIRKKASEFFLICDVPDKYRYGTYLVPTFLPFKRKKMGTKNYRKTQRLFGTTITSFLRYLLSADYDFLAVNIHTVMERDPEFSKRTGLISYVTSVLPFRFLLGDGLTSFVREAKACPKLSGEIWTALGLVAFASRFGNRIFSVLPERRVVVGRCRGEVMGNPKVIKLLSSSLRSGT